MAKKPTAAEIRRLVDQVERLVRAQTNIFIREFLRSLGTRPGANKDEFTESLTDAVKAGVLTQEKLDKWLRSVEGWGNQHIYAHSVPRKIARDPVWADEATVAALAKKSVPSTWRAATSRSFPPKPKLTRTDYDPERKLFLAEWHERTDTWARAKAKDRKPVESGGDTYWMKAYRYEPRRSVMRFALWLKPPVAKRPISALFLRYPVHNKEHKQAIELAWRDLGQIALDGGGALADLRNHPWSISKVIKQLDQEIVRARRPEIMSKSTTFSEGQASVRFVSEPDFSLPDTIREVRLSLPDSAIDDDEVIGSAGEFEVARDPDRATSREARVELFQDTRRIRIWTELDEQDVWSILQTFDGLRS